MDSIVQEAFGAYRAVVSDGPESVRGAAWTEVAETLRVFDAATGFIAPAEVLVAAGVNPAWPVPRAGNAAADASDRPS